MHYFVKQKHGVCVGLNQSINEYGYQHCAQAGTKSDVSQQEPIVLQLLKNALRIILVAGLFKLPDIVLTEAT